MQGKNSTKYTKAQDRQVFDACILLTVIGDFLELFF